jgi:hypothetical protein
LGGWAFANCERLTTVLLEGDAPDPVSQSAFQRASPELVILYTVGGSGFTSPTWEGYPAIEIDLSTHPFAIWLLEHGQPYDADLAQDLNGDGVPLLAAYALDLDPSQDLRASMPVPTWGEDGLSLTFHGAAPGVTYGAESTDGFADWTTDGVTLSEPDAGGRRTATLEPGAGRRFMRLVFSR